MDEQPLQNNMENQNNLESIATVIQQEQSVAITTEQPKTEPAQTIEQKLVKPPYEGFICAKCGKKTYKLWLSKYCFLCSIKSENKSKESKQNRVKIKQPQDEKPETIVCEDCKKEVTKIYQEQHYCEICSRTKHPKNKSSLTNLTREQVGETIGKANLQKYQIEHELERQHIFENPPELEELDYLKYKLDNEDLKYYMALRKKWVEEDGLPEGPLLNKLLFFSVTAKNLEIDYLKHSTNANPEKRKDALKFLKSLGDMIPKLEKIILSMKEMVDLSAKTKGIHDLIEETLLESEKFIKEHIGEHVVKCGNCNSIVGTDGLPHWAIQGKYKHHVFSPKGWKLFVNGKITLAQLAYILMTSPEGVIWTAQERGETLPDNIDLAKEENELKEYL